MSQSDRDKLRAQLERHEGNSATAYPDSLGYLTIGIGRCIDGRLAGTGLSVEEREYLLTNDIDARVRALAARYPWFVDLDPVRQAVLVNMAFMGIGKLAGFTKMLAAVAHGQYGLASDEMLDSRWASQVKHRADELAAQMRLGTWIV